MIMAGPCSTHQEVADKLHICKIDNISLHKLAFNYLHRSVVHIHLAANHRAKAASSKPVGDHTRPTMWHGHEQDRQQH
jgi:hypothetical protein